MVRSRVYRAWIVLFCIFSAIILYPLAVFFKSLFAWDDILWVHFYDYLFWTYLWNSIILVVGVFFCVLVLACFTGLTVTLIDFPGRKIFQRLFLLPLIFPSYILAYIYSEMWGTDGFVVQWLAEMYPEFFKTFIQGNWPSIRSLGGGILVFSLSLYPYAYLTVRSALLEQSSNVVQAAQVLGLGPMDIFRRVIIPLIRPSVIAGGVLVLMEVLSDFGVVKFYAIPTFVVGVEKFWFEYGEIQSAIQIGLFLFIFIFILLYLEKVSRKNREFGTKNYRPMGMYIQLKPWKKWIIFCISSCLVAMAFIFPFVFMMVAAVVRVKDVYMDLLILIMNTLLLMMISGIVILLCALMMVYVKRFLLFRMYAGVINLLTLGYAIPGMLIALSIVLVSEQGIGLELGSFLLLIWAYVVRFLGVAYHPLEGAMQRIVPSLDEVSYTLGASRTETVLRIHLPLLKKTLWVGLFFVCVDVSKELPMTLFLRPFNFDTLPVRIYEFAVDERLSDAMPFAAVLVFIGGIMAIFLERSFNKEEVSGSK